jgi:hypothetical protein
MEHFIRVVMENTDELHEGLNEDVFPGCEFLESEQGASVFHIPLTRQLTDEEADDYADKLVEYVSSLGYEDFDIEISTDEEAPMEETYDGDDFFEEYGVMWYNDDQDESIDERSEFEKYRNMRIVYDPETLEIKRTYPMTNRRQSQQDAEKLGLVATDGHKYLELRRDRKSMDEAEYQGRKVKLGKPMRGDVKKFKVYVRDPKTKNVKKVNFGDPNMKIKKSNPARRRSFRARHNCDNPGPRTKARYWSCRKW